MYNGHSASSNHWVFSKDGQEQRTVSFDQNKISVQIISKPISILGIGFKKQLIFLVFRLK
jgi:hypothetical protein